MWLKPDISQIFPSSVLNLDGNSEHVAHAWMKIGLFGEKKDPIGDRSKTKIAPYVRTYFWWTIYHAALVETIGVGCLCTKQDF